MYSDFDGFQVVSGKAPAIDENWPPANDATSIGSITQTISEQSMPKDFRLDKFQNVEDEQVQLNRSLLALTTHFAQVQFRLRQIVEADQEEKEVLLRELERFAFQGIPELNGSNPTAVVEEMSHREYEQKLDRQKDSQQKLITHLKLQLEDLERYAAQESARSTVSRPNYDLHDKQRVIIDELRAEDLKSKIDFAVKQEQLVKQLTTQVIDLERYISYLQGDTNSPGPYGRFTRMGMPYPSQQSVSSPPRASSRKSVVSNDEFSYDTNDDLSYYADSISSIDAKRQLQASTANVKEPEMTFVRRMLKILDIFGGGSDDLRIGVKPLVPTKIDTRYTISKLDEAVDRIIAVKCQMVERGELQKSLDLITSNSPNELFKIISRHFTNNFTLLLQHGLCETTETSLLAPMSCFAFMKSNNEDTSNAMHPWQLFVRFYNSRHGSNYNENPARRLSHSFGNDAVGIKSNSVKQTFLATVYDIISSPEVRYKTDDFKLRALIFAGLHSQKLTQWCKLISSSRNLMEAHYQSWAYVANGGFSEIIDVIEKLSPLKFDLPVTLTVHEKNDIFYS
ncbi:uncharacterized protein TRIADDRAFT_52054 [Trichoplax adhaerens]|uniref:RUN domain-containing protein n=1 Tax=Trichoplax adhaerens TaxID=10228 RepID=B3RLM4_TRIAD|nr:hypothetical protein TRIADDRAFT_52054 [Trichoplax adhaerens]EDV28808.1 hypothetical protein TRIADDRAFT_52054 [Trichoplax adhaerens]|eukprot:XP_002108010.1 hypothetical protein TRIADDRAFT_52054 [Trichoplax adhaerens]